MSVKNLAGGQSRKVTTHNDSLIQQKVAILVNFVSLFYVYCQCVLDQSLRLTQLPKTGYLES